jgi:hypothetical protein
MFTFFHRKRKVVVDCYTSDTLTHKYTPIVKAIKTIPSWWKSIPDLGIGDARTYPVPKNMKHCYGFIEFYKRGAVMESWADIHIEVENGGYQYTVSNTVNGGAAVDQPAIVVHPAAQYGNAFQNYHHGKLVSPWFFIEKTGLHFLYLGAEWALENYPFKMLPGVVEYHYNSGTDVNLMMPKASVGQSYSMFIPIGTPLVHIIPLNDDVNVEFRSHLVSYQERDLLVNRGSTKVFSGFRNLMKLDKRNNERKGKCPFH